MPVIIPNTIKAIAWDLDGTLIDSFGIFSKVVTLLPAEFGLAVPTPDTILKNFHGTLTESITGVFAGLDKAVIAKFEKRFLTEQERHYENAAEILLEDAVALAGQAASAGVKQVIITNRGHAGRGMASPRSIVERSELKDYIHHIICGDETGDFRKPDARVFGDLLERWQVRPDELLVIGDQHVDALLALNVGAEAIIVSRDADEPAHFENLPKGWEDHVRVVANLHDVTINS